MSSVVLGLSLVCIGLVVLLCIIGRRLRDMSDAVENRRINLLTKRGSMLSVFCVERLQQALNNLIEENRKQDEQERGQLSQIEAALSSIQEAVLIIDDQNRIVMANPAMEKLIGDEAGLMGKRLEARLRSADFLDYVRRIKHGERLPKWEVHFELGRKIQYFEVTGAIIEKGEGDSDSLTLFVLHDITRLKGLERMRTDFVANVSHELRTPVTVIKGFADALTEDHETMPTEARARFLTKIQKNVVRLQLLLEDLLTLTRLEGGDRQVELEPCILNDSIREVEDNFSRRVEEENKRLQIELEPSDAVVMADVIKINQVLDNLVENAMRHGRGGRTITIRTRVMDNHLRCSVEDDGCGIPEKDQPFVFQRFYRVDKGRSREYGGTGLGLSIVKHIIQQHNGEVYLESAEGMGTCITFELPLVHESVGVQQLLEARN